MNKAPARQIGGKVAALSLAPREALNSNLCRLGLGLVFSSGRSQLLELELQLIEKPLAALRARAELRALHLGDHQLLLLDQRLGARELGARLDQRRLERILVIGNGIAGIGHACDCTTMRGDSSRLSAA